MAEPGKPDNFAAPPDPAFSPSLAAAVGLGLASVGRHTYGPRIDVVRFDHATRLEIGSFVSMASGVTFVLGGEHRPEWVTTSPLRVMLQQPRAGADNATWSRGDIVVGNDVWIGCNATIRSGVRIGHGAVIGAGALVVDNVPDYAIVTGVPSQLLRFRFDEHMRSTLLRIAWWDWPDPDIIARIDDLLSTDVDRFVDRFGGDQARLAP